MSYCPGVYQHTPQSGIERGRRRREIIDVDSGRCRLWKHLILVRVWKMKLGNPPNRTSRSIPVRFHSIWTTPLLGWGLEWSDLVRGSVCGGCRRSSELSLRSSGQDGKRGSTHKKGILGLPLFLANSLARATHSGNVSSFHEPLRIGYIPRPMVCDLIVPMS